MTIIFIYLAMLIPFLVFFLLTRKYKKSITANLTSKDYPLKFLYGTAFFLIDLAALIQKKLFPNLSHHNSRLRKNLDKLYVGKDINKIEYLFHAKRISYALLILTGFIFIGFCYSFNSINSSQKVTSLQRTDEDTSYSLEVSLENKETQIIDISVKSKEYDFKETINIFENYRDAIVTALLDNNSSIESIQYPLNFISQIGSEGLNITWEVENENLIDYSGEIYPANIETYGAATTVTAHLTLGEHTASLTIPLILVP